MQLDDLKEKITEQFRSTWSRLQEQPFYLDLRERFESLPTKTQKLAVAGGATFTILLIFSFPLSFLVTSAQQMAFFDDARRLTQELLTVEREAQTVPQLPAPPAQPILRSQIQDMLQRAQLTEEQILPLEEVSQVQPADVLPANVQAQGLRVRLRKLNLQQITDLGSQLESQLGRGVKIWSFSMNENSEDPLYFDVEYQLVSFSVAGDPGGDI